VVESIITENWGRLVYLGLLFIAVGGYFALEIRRRPGRTLQQAAIWGLIFLGTLAAVGLWSDIQRQVVIPEQAVMTDGKIEVNQAPDGHYYLTAGVNGMPIRFVVDTGASQIVLTQKDAARAGIDTNGLAYIGQASTANGVVATAPIRIDSFDLGPIHDQNLRAVVNRGQMDTSLLGMTYLTRFAKVEFSRGKLILQR
jgi:aspartyl protease family protein